jgi:hypothetical protein
MRRLFFCAALLLSLPAQAESLSAEACARLNPVYVPGVDVHGKPVAPADLSEPAFTPSREIKIDLTVDAARFAGLPVPPGVEATAKLGVLEVKDGRLTLDGRALEPAAAEKLAQTLCPPEKPSK